ncbi:MAG: hypothetical protein QOK28_3712 [Actinomycetota bacterium]|jgi:signal transduction histidine kinase
MTTADELRSSDETLLSALAHELRTPLTAIRGFADLLVTLNDTDDELIRQEIITRLLRNAQQLESLVDNMLDAAVHARLEALEPQRISLRALAHEVVDNVALTLSPHSFDIHGEAAYAFADPYAVTRILVSLLTNAAHYSPDASVIEVETRQCPDGRALIVVTDAGPGVPECERGAVFDAYWRGDRARESYRGLGVGLSIARQLCEMSGGTIRVSDAPRGHGARFEVDFPAATP